MSKSWSFVKRGVPTAVLIVLIVAVVGALATRKTFLVEIWVPAPPEAVWEVLIDARAYPQWNPVFVEVDGTYAKGETVLNRVREPGGAILEMTATVETFLPNAELRQSGGIPGILTFNHRWLLEPADGGTKVIQHEVDRGIGLWFWNSDWIEPAYAATNDALAKRVQSVTATPGN